MPRTLLSSSESDADAAVASGKKMFPSRTIQPRCRAKATTSPSESRKRRDLVEEMGRLG